MLLFSPASSPFSRACSAIDTIDAFSIFKNTFKNCIFFAFINSAFKIKKGNELFFLQKFFSLGIL